MTAEAKKGHSGDYIDAVIKETLRVRPVVSEVFRAPTQPTELGGFLFAPRMQLAASILLVQYDPELYPPDPYAFRPERFLEGAPESYTWIPFGGGGRRCLGAAFAQLGMKIGISAVLARTRLRPPGPSRRDCVATRLLRHGFADCLSLSRAAMKCAYSEASAPVRVLSASRRVAATSAQTARPPRRCAAARRARGARRRIDS